MIKFKASTANGRKLIGLGLSHENLKRLKANKPIRFKGEDLGIEGVDVMIYSGRTEESMAKELDSDIADISFNSITKNHS